MASEILKTNKRRATSFPESYMVGKVIDISCGQDPVVSHAELYDVVCGDKDAENIDKCRLFKFYDTVYSSHRLGHMRDPQKALLNWRKVMLIQKLS